MEQNLNIKDIISKIISTLKRIPQFFKSFKDNLWQETKLLIYLLESTESGVLVSTKSIWRFLFPKDEPHEYHGRISYIEKLLRKLMESGVVDEFKYCPHCYHEYFRIPIICKQCNKTILSSEISNDNRNPNDENTWPKAAYRINETGIIALEYFFYEFFTHSSEIMMKRRKIHLQNILRSILSIQKKMRNMSNEQFFKNLDDTNNEILYNLDILRLKLENLIRIFPKFQNYKSRPILKKFNRIKEYRVKFKSNNYQEFFWNLITIDLRNLKEIVGDSLRNC